MSERANKQHNRRELGDDGYRSFLLARLRRRHAERKNTLIVEELGVCEGRSRIDIAVVNGKLHGYELKSDRDTLARLPVQSAQYSSIFDRITIVTSAKHAEQVVRIVPEWWAISCLVAGRSTHRLSLLRGGSDNPQVEALKLVQLLWRDEALDILRARKSERGFLSKNRDEVWSRVVDIVSTDELRRLVRTKLKQRLSWRSAPTRT